MNRGCELIEAWETGEMRLDLVHIEQDKLNEQGYFTVIHCTDEEKDLYKITVFQRSNFQRNE